MASDSVRTAGFKRMQAVKGHNAAWREDWEDTRGGFNPDVFKDLDDVTRQRLHDYQVGPSILQGDKHDRGLFGALQVGAWGDGVHGEAGPMNHFLWGGEDREKRAHNRGSVQHAAWEAGFANIGNKDQLNQFLDRADAIKAKHGDFLKDGWTPEAIMMMRGQPQQASSLSDSTPAPIEAPAAPARPTTPAVDSDHLADAKERAQAFQNGFGNSSPFSSYGGQNTGAHRITQANQALNQSNNFQVYGDTSNV